MMTTTVMMMTTAAAAAAAAAAEQHNRKGMELEHACFSDLDTYSHLLILPPSQAGHSIR